MADELTPRNIGVAQLLSDYQPHADIPDEMMTSTGEVKPVWRDFVTALGGQTADDIAMRIARGDQYLSDAGVFFRQASTETQAKRQWPLGAVPVLIDESEWDSLVQGLSERADLLEAIMQDLYGNGTLVENGHIPARLIAQSDEWIRPMVGVTTPSGSFLHFVAFEVGRAPNGQWWVLNDRTQAPSGAGFALENRVATSRIYSDIMARMNVYRLAEFFGAFQNSLARLQMDEDSPAALLTPGPLSATYYEHAYIARYLGMLLVEGEDIIVIRGRPMVRTVSGPKPISVLWRRLDTQYSDPLELNEESRIGIPGLIGALRQNAVNVINAIGSGILETRALLAFIPRLSEVLHGKPLAIPNVATWWCGQEAERQTVLSNLDRMTLAPALSTRLPFDPDDNIQLGGKLTTRDPEAMRALLDHLPEAIVGQEIASLSTTPALVNGDRLTPRPFSLRVFLGRTENGWKALPGGYARIGASDDISAVSMHSGGSVSDVWIVSNTPVPEPTLIGAVHDVAGPAMRAALPSRAAENLFWLGRYLERAENTIRLARAQQHRRIEAGEIDTPLLDYLNDYMHSLGVAASGSVRQAIADATAAAAGCARRVSDRLSPDGLMAVEKLEDMARDLAALDPGQSSTVMRKSHLLHQLAAFTGLAHENMFRSMAWRFLASGKALERAVAYSVILSWFTDPAAPDGALEVALECCDSIYSHRLLHGFERTSDTVRQHLFFETDNPRSVAAQFIELEEHLIAMPPQPETDMAQTPIGRLDEIGELFSVRRPDELTTEHLTDLKQRLWALSDSVQAAYMT